MRNSIIKRAVLSGLMVLCTSSASAPKPNNFHYGTPVLAFGIDISILTDCNRLQEKLVALYPPANWQDGAPAPEKSAKPRAVCSVAVASPP